jgi:uncharacterized glyoxalase superfamily protein PhnB
VARQGNLKEDGMAVSYKPADHQNAIPYLLVPNAEQELAFVKDVFSAIEMHVSRDPQGRIGHASVKIGDSVIMMGQSSEQWPATPAAIYLYVTDVDAAYARGLAAGASSVMQPADYFYGDRNAGVKDGNGVQWWMATHIEDVSAEDMQNRTAEEFKKHAQAQA